MTFRTQSRLESASQLPVHSHTPVAPPHKFIALTTQGSSFFRRKFRNPQLAGFITENTLLSREKMARTLRVLLWDFGTSRATLVGFAHGAGVAREAVKNRLTDCW